MMYKFVIIQKFDGSDPEIVASGDYNQMAQRLVEIHDKFRVSGNTVEDFTKTTLHVKFHGGRHMDPDDVKFWIRRKPSTETLAC